VTPESFFATIASLSIVVRLVVVTFLITIAGFHKLKDTDLQGSKRRYQTISFMNNEHHAIFCFFSLDAMTGRRSYRSVQEMPANFSCEREFHQRQ
jgi:hypothetical protein